MRTTHRHDGSFGLAFWSGTAPRMTVAHRHDDLEFNHSDVDLVYMVDGAERLLPAGEIGAFWAARPHQLVSDLRGGTVTWLTVPLQVALGWRLPPRFLERTLSGATVLGPAAGALDLRERVHSWVQDRGTAAQAAIDLEVQAFALRVALCADVPSPEAGEAEPARVAADVPGSRLAPTAASMAAWISAHADEDIRAADVARAVHLTPAHAMTVFRRSLGTTIGDYLTQCRIARAQHLLLTTAIPVPEVGARAGFQSQSQFYARFAERCGVPPAAYRRRAQG